MKGPTILVVDDDVDFLEWSRCVLEPAGYRVACCSDSETALARIAEDAPAVVTTDLMMKSLDSGFSLAERIKGNPDFAAIPVIIITAAASQRGFDFRPQTPEDLKAMRADAFFCKPVAPQALLATIESFLGAKGTAKTGAPNGRETAK